MPGLVAFTTGHASVSFTGDCAALTVAGQAVGLFLSGKGSLAYVSGFAPEAPVFTRNLREWTPVLGQPGPQGVKATIPFLEMRLYGAGTLLPAWRGTPGSDLIPALERHAKAFGAVAGFDPCQLLALQQANCPGQALLIAELGDGASR